MHYLLSLMLIWALIAKQSVMAQVLYTQSKPLTDNLIDKFFHQKPVTITYFDTVMRQKQLGVITATKSKKEVGLLQVDTSRIAIPTSRSSDWLRSIPAIPPVRLASYTQYRISSHFGWRVHPINGKRHRHTGIDLPYPVDTPIYATADGVVNQLISDQAGLGFAVSIRHPSGYESVYGHLSACTVRAGDTVLRGEMIGRVGSTGRSTGPHLHYAILYLGKPINPEHYCLLWLAINSKDERH
jgi:murein DD-endopeptidase MepM/ murein hydrolase activator NlpD